MNQRVVNPAGGSPASRNSRWGKIVVQIPAAHAAGPSEVVFLC